MLQGELMVSGGGGGGGSGSSGRRRRRRERGDAKSCPKDCKRRHGVVVW